MKKFNIACVGAGAMFQYCVRVILKDPQVNIPAIFTWSEKAAHRMSRFVPMDSFSRQTGVPLIKVESMNDPAAVRQLEEMRPDLVFVDGWSEKLLPPALEAAKEKFVCIHPSLLPKSRGGATLNWALIRGEKEWGITLFYLANEIDKGDIIDQERFFIEERDDIQTVFDKAALAAMDLLERTLPLFVSGKAARRPQNDADATFFHRRKPAQGEIDWTQSSRQIRNLVRALTHPYPGAFFYWNGEKVFVWKAAIAEETGGLREKKAGQPVRTVPGKGIVAACGEGAILLERIQSEKEPVLWGDQWFQRHEIEGKSFNDERTKTTEPSPVKAR